MKTTLLVAFAMLAFAANSLLNRAALSENLIDVHNFTLIRLVSGAAALLLIVSLKGQYLKSLPRAGNWFSAAMLYCYALSFSVAYMWLGAGMGALILFAAVQITMLGMAIAKGDRPTPLELVGLVLALVGFVALVSPGFDQAPSLPAVGLMTAAGIAWGGYSLWGRGSKTPTLDTAGNFWRASVMALLTILPILLLQLSSTHLTIQGVLLACLSGAIASGVGYAIWYAALPALSRTRAGIVQLSVPALAAIAGVVFLSEPITLKFVLLTVLILLGVGLATVSKSKKGAENKA